MPQNEKTKILKSYGDFSEINFCQRKWHLYLTREVRFLNKKSGNLKTKLYNFSTFKIFFICKKTA